MMVWLVELQAQWQRFFFIQSAEDADTAIESCKKIPYIQERVRCSTRVWKVNRYTAEAMVEALHDLRASIFIEGQLLLPRADQCGQVIFTQERQSQMLKKKVEGTSEADW